MLGERHRWRITCRKKWNGLEEERSDSRVEQWLSVEKAHRPHSELLILPQKGRGSVAMVRVEKRVVRCGCSKAAPLSTG